MVFRVTSYEQPEGDPDERYLVYVGQQFPWYIQLSEQADTDTIAKFAEPHDKWVIQKINDAFEVYALKSLAPIKFMQGFTIGSPRFTHENFDAALMWALMNL